MALSDKRAAFVREYLVDGNATQAAIRAGYSERSAGQTAHRLLEDEQVAAAIADGQAALNHEAGITAARIRAELACLAFSDVGALYDGSGKLLPVHQMPEEARRAVAGIKVRAEKDADAEVIEVKLWDKRAALDMAARLLGLYKPDKLDVNLSGPVEVTELVVATREQAKAAVAAAQGPGRVPRQ